MLLLSLVGAAGGGVYVWKLLERSDAIARRELQRALAETLPDWDVSFDDLHLDLRGTARLRDLRLSLRGRKAPLVHVPEVTAVLDRDLLAGSQVVHIQRITLHDPTVWVTRDEAGTWNWAELTPPPPSDAPCPEIDIVRGTILVHSARTHRLPETEFSCRAVNGRLVPSGHRRYAVRIMTDVDHAGELAIVGSIDLTTRAWRLTGDIAALDTQQGALGVAAGLSPELREQMTALSEQTGTAPPAPGAGAAHPRPITSHDAPAAVRSAASRTPRSAFALPELGVQAQLDLHFEIGRSGQHAPLEYFVAATIHQGAIVNAALPIPLHDLNGRVRASNSEVVIEDLAASNGDTRLHVSGRLERLTAGWSRDFSIRAVNLELDRRIRDYLHDEAWRRMYDQLQPAGRFNLDVRVTHDGAARWGVTLNEFTALRCALLHEAFQYPITDITGVVRQEGTDFRVELDGYAGDRPVALRGLMRNPGPDMEASFHIAASNIPLDARVVDALQLPKLQPVRRALQRLRLEGLADVDATLARPPGPQQKFGLRLRVAVHDAALEDEQFPYRLTDFSGVVNFDPDIEPVWHFQNLQGRHGSTILTGRATYDLRTAPGRLQIAVTARAVPIDQPLQRACVTANPALGRIWEELSPAGTLDLDDARLDWTPGRTVQVVLPSVSLTGGRLRLRALPYAWDDVSGVFSWNNGAASLRSTLKGRHNGTTIEIVGDKNNARAAFVELQPQPNLDWRVHLEDVRIRGLLCDQELRRALPPRLAALIAALDLHGPIDTDLGIDLKGIAAGDQVTAMWWQRVRLSGNRLTAGVGLEQVTGNVEILQGEWFGESATIDGFVELAAARVLDVPLRGIRGPFAVDGNQVSVGTPDWQNPNWRRLFVAPVAHSERNPYRGSPLRVEHCYSDERHEGTLGLNALALVDPVDPQRTRYRVGLTLRDASLRAWAQDRRIDVRQLRGSVNSMVELEGQGPSSHAILGSGWVQLSDAELFELPVFAQMLPLLNFKRTGKTLFNSGFGEFRLHDGRVDFSAIELSGDALRLVGRGSAEFAPDSVGRLQFNFYSKADDQFLVGLSRVPVVGSVFDNWVHVRVDGTLKDPFVVQQPGNPQQFVRELVNDVEKLRRQLIPPGMLPQPPPQSGPRPPGR